MFSGIPFTRTTPPPAAARQISGPSIVLSEGIERLTYEVRNFESLESVRGQGIELLPAVRAHGWDWTLLVCARGHDNSSQETEHVSVYLKLATGNTNTGSVAARYSIRCKDFEKTPSGRVFDTNHVFWGWSNFLRRDDVIENYLDGDGTLKIEVDITAVVCFDHLHRSALDIIEADDDTDKLLLAAADRWLDGGFSSGNYNYSNDGGQTAEGDSALVVEEDGEAKRSDSFLVHLPINSETETKKDDDCYCVICCDSPRSHVFLPCGHMCVCQQCGDKIMRAPASTQQRRCPICMQLATGINRVFL